MGLLKAVDPYSLMVLNVFTKDNRRDIYVEGSKYDILAKLKEDYKKLEIYQLSLRDMIDTRCNDKVKHYIYIIAKEN